MGVAFDQTLEKNLQAFCDFFLAVRKHTEKVREFIIELFQKKKNAARESKFLLVHFLGDKKIRSVVLPRGNYKVFCQVTILSW